MRYHQIIEGHVNNTFDNALHKMAQGYLSQLNGKISSEHNIGITCYAYAGAALAAYEEKYGQAPDETLLRFWGVPGRSVMHGDIELPDGQVFSDVAVTSRDPDRAYKRKGYVLLGTQTLGSFKHWIAELQKWSSR